MTCPNCAKEIDPATPTATRHPEYVHSTPNLGHADGCILVALLGTLEDRGHDLTKCNIEAIEADGIWQEFGGPATDAVAEDLGITAYPEGD